MSTSWNDAEDEALDYLPHAAQLLYLRILRRNMDYKTGTVGLKRRISYRAMIEWLEVRSGLGGTEGVTDGISLDRARWLVKLLIKHGLIVRVPGYERTLVFKLPHATTDDSDPMKYTRGTPEEHQTNHTTINATPNASGGAGFEHNSAANNTRGTPEEHQRKSTTHPVSVINNSLSTRARVDTVLRSTISESWRPSDNTIARALIHALPDASDELTILAFVSHYRGKGEVCADWDAMYIKWLARERAYQQQPGGGNGSHKRDNTGHWTDVIAEGCDREWQRSGR